MALIKTTPWKFGLNITYWMISDINIMKIENITRVGVAGYINNQHRTEKINEPATVMSFDIDGIGFTVENLYGKIKESKYDDDGNEILSFFHDAIDDI